MSSNPYDILGVDKNASDKDIKSAYRKLAKNITLILILIVKMTMRGLKIFLRHMIF